MARRISSTEVKVHLVKLRLSILEIDRLDSVRREAARLWNDIVAYHAQSRDKAKEEGSLWSLRLSTASEYNISTAS